MKITQINFNSSYSTDNYYQNTSKNFQKEIKTQLENLLSENSDAENSIISKNIDKYLTENENSEQNRQINAIKEDLKRMYEENKMSQISSKLQLGIQLSPSDLKYLKEKNPQLYQKSLEIKHETEIYKRLLKNCKTKDEVNTLHMNQIQGCMSQIKSIKGNSKLSADSKNQLCQHINNRMASISREYRNFIKSKEYKALPTEEELRKKKKRKKMPNINNNFYSLKSKLLDDIDLSYKSNSIKQKNLNLHKRINIKV